MKNLLRILPVLAVAAFLAGCEGPCQKIDTISGPALTSGSADFSNVAAVGTSISAGYQSGGLVNRHQVRGFPALFAAHVGRTVLDDGTGDFTFNAINNDGIPTLLEIKSLSPLVISNAGRTSGAPLNNAQATPYHNLAIPGQLAVDLVDSTYYTVDPNAVRGAGYNKTFFNLVYRHAAGFPRGITQLLMLQPTFVTYEFGANEVLGAATSGTANVFPTANYVASVRGALAALHAVLPNAKVAIFNVPGVTTIPFCTTFSPVTISTITGTPVALIGSNGALSPTDLVLLTAKDSLVAGTGFPVGGYNYLNPAAPGNGRPLLGSQVLDDGEQGTINTTIFNMNTALDSIVANRPWTAKVDFNTLLADIRANGFTIGATTYTSDFVTGGLFSLDGVHPNDLAHAIMANLLIDAVNARWDATIPHLNVSNYATATSSRMRPAADGAGVKPQRVDGLEERLKMLFPAGF
jgi:hypothetical protein